MADLVESEDDVAGRVETGHVGALMGVDDDAAGVAGELGAELLGELGMGVGSERGIDAVEGVMAVGRVDDNAIVMGGDRGARAVDGLDADLARAWPGRPR